MKKFGLILILLVFIIKTGFSQFQFIDNPDIIDCDYDSTIHNKSIEYIPYGGVFTPKGDIRVLIIFASFGGVFDTIETEGWDAGANFPNWATQRCFYQDTSDFSNNIYDDTNQNSVSNYYYQMSNGKFRLIADFYPQKIIVPTPINKEYSSWGDVNKAVIEQIPSTFNWSKYDNRKNRPLYTYDNDNSNSAPDSIIDYIVFCYRFSHHWDAIPYNFVVSDCPTATGVASTNIQDTTTQDTNYKVSKDGFTAIVGGTPPTNVFIHELGHVLYKAPHYNGGNGVYGNYFYAPSTGWGMMLHSVFTCPLAWERWILAWNEITASGRNSDINSKNELLICDTFTLRDYITTGDAIRIKIPNGNSDTQHLWIENHQGKSIFDNCYYGDDFCGSPITKKQKGIAMYVESIQSSRHKVSPFYCNGIRYLHADGNYNFDFDTTPLYPHIAYCNNKTYQIYKKDKNPIGGQNIGEYIRHDFDNDGIIATKINANCNTNPHYEATPVIVLDGDTTAKYITGEKMLFKVGDKINLSTNPMVLNIPKYDKTMLSMEAYYLNGISIEIINQKTNGDITIKIKMDDVNIRENTIYSAASIVLQNTTNDTLPDLNVLPNVTLTIDKSKTPNRHKKVNYGNLSGIDKFITPTTFTCDSSSLFR